MLAYSVMLRQREVGIRKTLGSCHTETATLILRQAALMAMVGLVPGIAGAWLSGHAIRWLLFGVRSLDGVTVALAAMLPLVTTVLAAALLTLRAVQVDRTEMLRSEEPVVVLVHRPHAIPDRAVWKLRLLRPFLKR